MLENNKKKALCEVFRMHNWTKKSLLGFIKCHKQQMKQKLFMLEKLELENTFAQTEDIIKSVTVDAS